MVESDLKIIISLCLVKIHDTVDLITDTTFEGQSTAVSATLGAMEGLAYLKQLTMDNPKVT